MEQTRRYPVGIQTFMADSKNVVKVGVSFDKETRTISNWAIA